MSLLDPFVDLIDSADWLTDAVEGPLRDFAQTSLGQVVLRATATSLAAALGPIVGPQLASIAFALPGLARGDKLTEAWVKEFSWRLNKLAEIYGGDAAKRAMDEMKIAIDWLKQESANRFQGMAIDEGIKRLNLDIEDVAKKLGISEEIAARAIWALTEATPFESTDRYRLETGKKTPLISAREAIRIAKVPGSPQWSLRLASNYSSGSVRRWMRAIP